MNANLDRSCPDCHTDMFTADPHPNYDHIHCTPGGRLPRKYRSDSLVISPGYAVGLAGKIPQIWVFFDYLEPAYAFARAGRMSAVDFTCCGIYAAACEVRWSESLDRDIRTLHIALETEVHRGEPGERDLLTRWVQGTSPKSSYYLGPAGS